MSDILIDDLAKQCVKHKKINMVGDKTETFKSYKFKAARAARELGYGKAVSNEILCAKSARQVTQILSRERVNASNLDKCDNNTDILEKRKDYVKSLKSNTREANDTAYEAGNLMTLKYGRIKPQNSQ